MVHFGGMRPHLHVYATYSYSLHSDYVYCHMVTLIPHTHTHTHSLSIYMQSSAMVRTTYHSSTKQRWQRIRGPIVVMCFNAVVSCTNVSPIVYISHLLSTSVTFLTTIYICHLSDHYAYHCHLLITWLLLCAVMLLCHVQMYPPLFTSLTYCLHLSPFLSDHYAYHCHHRT